MSWITSVWIIPLTFLLTCQLHCKFLTSPGVQFIQSLFLILLIITRTSLPSLDLQQPGRGSCGAGLWGRPVLRRCQRLWPARARAVPALGVWGLPRQRGLPRLFLVERLRAPLSHEPWGDGWAYLARVRGQPCLSLLCPSLPSDADRPRRDKTSAFPSTSPHRLPWFPQGLARIRNKAAKAGPGLEAGGPYRDPPDRPGAPPAPGRPRHLAAAAGAAGGGQRLGWDAECAFGRKTARETSQPEKLHSACYFAVYSIFIIRVSCRFPVILISVLKAR